MLDSLCEAKDDRQSDDTSEAIPLLPLTEDSIKAMDDHNFLNFIAKMGLTPPANEQVMPTIHANQSVNPNAKESCMCQLYVNCTSVVRQSFVNHFRSIRR